mmetsp:Transcript_7929/g.16595  ORF Transcript_7929/g.16595 Transcript_7929/m.16595 type:complete len:329 (+) Transcript_7929:605-1591(+)
MPAILLQSRVIIPTTTRFKSENRSCGSKPIRRRRRMTVLLLLLLLLSLPRVTRPVCHPRRLLQRAHRRHLPWHRPHRPLLLIPTMTMTLSPFCWRISGKVSKKWKYCNGTSKSAIKSRNLIPFVKCNPTRRRSKLRVVSPVPLSKLIRPSRRTFKWGNPWCTFERRAGESHRRRRHHQQQQLWRKPYWNKRPNRTTPISIDTIRRDCKFLPLPVTTPWTRMLLLQRYQLTARTVAIQPQVATTAKTRASSTWPVQPCASWRPITKSTFVPFQERGRKVASSRRTYFSTFKRRRRHLPSPPPQQQRRHRQPQEHYNKSLNKKNPTTLLP